MSRILGDTGWKGIGNVVGGDEYARGDVEVVQGKEKRPCMSCKSWEKDEHRLIEHLLWKGLEPRPDGKFITPIAKDFPGRRSLVIDPKSWGFCRLETRPTDCLATCPAWQPVKTAAELASRIR